MSLLQEEEQECIEWVNKILSDEKPIESIDQLHDGTKLIRALEKLTQKKASRYFPNGRTLFQIQQNITILLKMIETAYGKDIMFDVSELSRGNKQQFLSLVFFVSKKSGTRGEKKRKFVVGKMTIGKLFEQRFQKDQLDKIQSKDTMQTLIEELNNARYENKSDARISIDHSMKSIQEKMIKLNLSNSSSKMNKSLQKEIVKEQQLSNKQENIENITQNKMNDLEKLNDFIENNDLDEIIEIEEMKEEIILENDKRDDMTLDEIENMIADNVVKFHNVGEDKFKMFQKCKKTQMKAKIALRETLKKAKLEQNKSNEEIVENKENEEVEQMNNVVIEQNETKSNVKSKTSSSSSESSKSNENKNKNELEEKILEAIKEEMKKENKEKSSSKSLQTEEEKEKEQKEVEKEEPKEIEIVKQQEEKEIKIEKEIENEEQKENKTEVEIKKAKSSSSSKSLQTDENKEEKQKEIEIVKEQEENNQQVIVEKEEPKEIEKDQEQKEVENEKENEQKEDKNENEVKEEIQEQKENKIEEINQQVIIEKEEPKEEQPKQKTTTSSSSTQSTETKQEVVKTIVDEIKQKKLLMKSKSSSHSKKTSTKSSEKRSGENQILIPTNDNVKIDSIDSSEETKSESSKSSEVNEKDLEKEMEKMKELTFDILQENKEDISNKLMEESESSEEEKEKQKEQKKEKEFTKTYSENDINNIIKIQALIRGKLTRKQTKSTMRLLIQRQHVVRELIATEVSYVSKLNQFKDGYLIPLTQAFPNDKILKKCLEDILVIVAYNTQISISLKALETKNQLYGQGVGDIFQRLSHFLKTYCSYINNTDSINDHEKKSRSTNKKFDQKLQQLENEKCLDPFNSYVILPVQRIPRYRLMLQELIKTVPQGHKERSKLDDALNKILEIGVLVNENKRKMENQLILNQLFKQLKYPFGMKPFKLNPSTKFIKFGILSMYDEAAKSKCRTVNVFLFNDAIIFTKILAAGTKTKLVSETVQSIVSSKKTLTVENIIPTEKYAILDCVTIDDCPTFTIITDDQNPIRLYCLSEEEKNGWIADLDAQKSSYYEQHLLSLKRSNSIKKDIVVPEKMKKPSNTVYNYYHGTIENATQYMILENDSLTIYKSPIDAFNRKNSLSTISTNYLSVKLVQPNSIEIENYETDEVEKITIDCGTLTSALMWIYQIRQQTTWRQNYAKVTDDYNCYYYLVIDILHHVQSDYHNQFCADCGCNEITHVDLEFGVYLCEQCSQIHKQFNVVTQQVFEIDTLSINVTFEMLKELIEKGNVFNNVERISKPIDFKSERDENEDTTKVLFNKYNVPLSHNKPSIGSSIKFILGKTNLNTTPSLDSSSAASLAAASKISAANSKTSSTPSKPSSAPSKTTSAPSKPLAIDISSLQLDGSLSSKTNNKQTKGLNIMISPRSSISLSANFDPFASVKKSSTPTLEPPKKKRRGSLLDNVTGDISEVSGLKKIFSRRRSSSRNRSESNDSDDEKKKSKSKK